MIDKRKILIMTKMATYDKKYGEKDTKINEYFRHDYVYEKNMWDRLFVGIGVLIITIFDILSGVVIDGEDITHFFSKTYISSSLFKLFLIMFIYTIIGTIKYNIEYSLTQKRLNRYLTLIHLLDKTVERRGDNKEEIETDSKEDID